MNKTAVDKTCKEYWSKYFLDYGQMWTKDVPRRIKQAVRRKLEASTIDGEVAPIAKDVAKDGTLSIEAAFIGKLDNKDARVLVTATFNKEGRMEDLDVTRIS